MRRVNCPGCGAGNWVAPGDREATCAVCGVLSERYWAGGWSAKAFAALVHLSLVASMGSAIFLPAFALIPVLVGLVALAVMFIFGFGHQFRVRR